MVDHFEKFMEEQEKFKRQAEFSFELSYLLLTQSYIIYDNHCGMGCAEREKEFNQLREEFEKKWQPK